MFGTKTDSGKKHHASLDRLANRAMQIRTERLTGYPRDPRLMTLRSYIALQIIEQMVEDKRITRENRLTAILMAGLRVKQER
jgi:hypothetical protein